MHLNIKNDDAHELAKQLAAITGESMTMAVTEALRERLERIKRDRHGGRKERLMAIADRCASRLKEPWKSMDIDEFLYDENGLPK